MKFSEMKVRKMTDKMEQRKKGCGKGVINSVVGIKSKMMEVEGS